MSLNELAEMARVLNFNPKQARDKQGKWSKSGGTSRLVNSPLPSDSNDINSEALQWKIGLSTVEKKSVASWAGNGQLEMRPEIASGNMSQQSKEFMSAIEKAPKVEGTVYRGLNGAGADEQIANIKSAGIGGTWTDTAPMSTSAKAYVSADFAGARDVGRSGDLMFRIQSKTGRDIVNASPLSFQAEVVSMPGTKYRIAAIRENHSLDIEGLGKVKMRMFVDLVED